MKQQLNLLFLLFSFFLVGAFGQLQAQVTIGAGTVPDKNAVLDLISNDAKGLLLPRLKLESKGDATPLTEHVAGMVVYNTGTKIDAGYYFNDGTQWVLLADTNSSPWRNAETGEHAVTVTENIYQAGQIAIGTSELHPSAQLDITSTTRGILISRMTTQQRNAVDVTGDASGLFIFNTTTNCFNYYDKSKTKWMSMCGTYEPANLILVDCTGGPLGAYKVGTSLNTSNTYTINVRVTEVGTYQILAKTASDNGYSFSKSGIYTETGNFTVVLEGQGIPKQEANALNNGLDQVIIEINGTVVTPQGCSLPGIEVEAATASFDITCSAGEIAGAVVYGTYEKGESVGTSHYVEIPVTVTSTGILTIETDEVNGMKFSSGSVDLTASTTSIKLYAAGIPTNVSNAQVNPTKHTLVGKSCSFSVPVISTLGGFKNPSKNCLEILAENSFAADGEYWIKRSSSSGAPVKTLCDMTNGGFTLIWSYSENVARYIYGNSKTDMSIYSTPQLIGLKYSYPQNVVTTEAGQIPFQNYRLDLPAIRNIQVGNLSEYRVKIVYKPEDINDAWGKENYLHIKPTASTYDIISSTGNVHPGDKNTQVPVTGRIFNLDFNRTSSSGGSGLVYTLGNVARGNSWTYFGDYGYGDHFDSTATGVMSQESTITKEDGTTMTITVSTYLNNMFGFFGETGANHHFGKCGAGSDDYSFSPLTCGSATKFPHSFNNGEGRYLQWWIK